VTPAARLRAMAEKARGTPAQAVIIGAELAALYADLIEAAANVGPVLYAYLHDQDTDDHNVRALMDEVDAALAAIDAADKEGV